MFVLAVNEELREELELPDGATAGLQLERGLELLVARLLNQPQRKGRTVLAVQLTARFESGGSWVVSQAMGKPTSSEKIISSLLIPKLDELRSPPSSLSIRATALGTPDSEQLFLPDTSRQANQDRLDEAVRQLRSLAGPNVVLGIIDVDTNSRIPERWTALSPYSPSRTQRRTDSQQRHRRTDGAPREADH